MIHNFYAGGITKFWLFSGPNSHFSDFLYLMRSKCGDKGVGRRHVWCVHPLGHHLKAGEVFLQGSQPTAVATEDDSRSGDVSNFNFFWNQQFLHIWKVSPNFSRYLPSRSESLVVLRCFLENAKSFFPALARLWLYMSAEIKKIPDCLKKLRCIFRFQLFWLNGICRKNLSLNIILCGVQSYCFNDHLEERNSINCFRRVLHYIETMSPEPSVRRGSRKKSLSDLPKWR